jgi:hypothetical protein
VAASEKSFEEDWQRDYDPFSSGGSFEGGAPGLDEWM